MNFYLAPCDDWRPVNHTPHTSLATGQKLLRLGREVILHPPYSPDDRAPPDYYLFQSLQNSLNGKTFNDGEAVKSHTFGSVFCR